MSSRLAQFDSHAMHPALRMLYDRLNDSEREACRAFIEANDHLNRDDFAWAVNRWMLDQPKPKRHADMWALVIQSNGRAE